jgi:mRNA interferase MazF
MVMPAVKPAARSGLKIQRYHLYWVNLDPTQGSEIAKVRPALVVSPDAMNKRIETVVICPLTSHLHPLWASRVQCECAGKPGEIAIDQIRTVSRQRLQKHIGKIDAETAAQVRESIALLYATA